MSRAMVATAQNMVMDEGGGIVREEAIRQRRARGVRRGGGRGGTGAVTRTGGGMRTKNFGRARDMAHERRAGTQGGGWDGGGTDKQADGIHLRGDD